ncbi:MAG: hypothetical protein PVJ57_05755 [Phycisphaerae bacterium]
MRTIDHRENLSILREKVAAFLEGWAAAVRAAELSGRSPACPEYENSLRLPDDRFVAVLQGEGDRNGVTLQYCVGSGSRVNVRGEPFDRHAPRESWESIARMQTPWVVNALLVTALSDWNRSA